MLAGWSVPQLRLSLITTLQMNDDVHWQISVCPSQKPLPQCDSSLSEDQIFPRGLSNWNTFCLGCPRLLSLAQKITQKEKISILGKNIFSGYWAEFKITTPTKKSMVLQRSPWVSRTQGPHRLNKVEKRKVKRKILSVSYRTETPSWSMKVFLQETQYLLYSHCLQPDVWFLVAKGETQSVSFLPSLPPRLLHTRNRDFPKFLLMWMKGGKA